MEQNKELRLAWTFVEHTGTSIFLTGKAGTGKTTFLRTVKAHSSKQMIVVAPTGVAAINAQGVTIHSFFQLPFSPYVPGMTFKDRYDFSKEKRRILKTLDMLVIDEVSMVRADLLDAVDFVLRRYRNPTRPFGGVQLLMIGDLQQLTPVVKPEEEQILRQYYNTPYFFGSHALQQISYVTIQLTHVYRQQDETFINILNHIREGQPSAEDLQALNARYQPAFIPREEDGYIRLTTHNRLADDYNENALMKLPGKRWTFKAEVKDTFPEFSYPADVNLELKVGAQVMFIKNDTSGKHLYYNGRIGHVVDITAKGIYVKCPGDEQAIVVEQQVWENTKYVINDQTKVIEPQVQGTFTQYPLRLAWSITIHKSQGLTFEHAIIDAGHSFASGQVYVALSRCKSLEGLALATPLQQYNIINDSRVTDYIAHQQQAAEESIQQLPALQEEYYRQQLLDLFDFRPLYDAEQLVYRTLVEYFRSFRDLNNLHRQALSTLKEQVMDVAFRWQGIIRQMAPEEMHKDVFLERVQNSARYFLKSLKDVVPDVLDKTKTARNENKVAMKLMDERYKDFWQQYLAKAGLLSTMSDETFTVAGYMRTKQRTLLEAMDLVLPGSVRRPPRQRRSSDNPFDDATTIAKAMKKEAQRRPRLPKGATQEMSFNMASKGMTVAQIAAERHLAESPILSHLTRYVREGKLTAAQVIGEAKMKAIAHAIGQLDEVTVDKVQEICRKDITRNEIFFVIDILGKRQRQQKE